MKIDGAISLGDINQSGAAARALEREGFDGAFSFEGPHDPFFPLLLAARETERIELGTAIAVAFARNPMICAQIANDLQTLSGGRFILGLGTQIRPHIEKRFSQTWSRPAARMREFVSAIRAIWQCWADGGRLDVRGEFYTHTLMTPLFSPGANEFGPPPIYVAGVGPRMVEVCGEVGDGFLVHPFHSRDYLLAETLPALRRGLQRSERAPGSCVVSCQTIIALGSKDEEVEAARGQARGQISFYGSTPAYKGLLEHHGYHDLQPKLNRMSKEGRWTEMMGEIDDELFDAIAVSGTVQEVAKRLRQRNDFADRSMLILYNQTDPEAVGDLLKALRGA